VQHGFSETGASAWDRTLPVFSPLTVARGVALPTQFLSLGQSGGALVLLGRVGNLDRFGVVSENVQWGRLSCSFGFGLERFCDFRVVWLFLFSYLVEALSFWVLAGRGGASPPWTWGFALYSVRVLIVCRLSSS